jgi:hypothetical protein
MLEHVALGQSRFMTPGVAPDPRGVLLGRYGLLVFPSLEGVVSWLRVYSAEAPLDELLSELAIQHVRTPLKSRAMVVRVPAASSYTLDRAARCATLVGGATYTGTSKHFVKYRDDRSPYGYDAAEVQALPPGAAFAVHGDDFVQTFAVEGELPFVDLLFRLSLRRLPGAINQLAEERGELVVVVERGLGDGVVRYLWRSRIAGRMALVSPQGGSAFDERRRYLYLRVGDLPRRILDLFLATPGIAVFRPVTGNVAVEVGFGHPVDLASCASVFDQARGYLFWGAGGVGPGGRGDRVDVIEGPIELTDIAQLTRIELPIERVRSGEAARVEPPPSIGVALELAPTLAAPRRVVGALVPLERIDWVKRLVYFLPQTALRGQRIAVTDHGVVVLAGRDADVLPLGHALVELAPGLLVPLGMDLVPRVAPDVLARSLGHGTGMVTVFPLGGTPFQLLEEELVPLERRALATIEMARATASNTQPSSVEEPTIVNDPVGRFALWGFRAPPRESK